MSDHAPRFLAALTDDTARRIVQESTLHAIHPRQSWLYELPDPDLACLILVVDPAGDDFARSEPLRQPTHPQRSVGRWRWSAARDASGGKQLSLDFATIRFQIPDVDVPVDVFFDLAVPDTRRLVGAAASRACMTFTIAADDPDVAAGDPERLVRSVAERTPLLVQRGPELAAATASGP